MTCITINIPDEKFEKLERLASSNNISTEELLCASIEEWLYFPKQDFTEVAKYVIQKNAELYSRLA
jgi:antitoxin FitA